VGSVKGTPGPALPRSGQVPGEESAVQAAAPGNPGRRQPPGLRGESPLQAAAPGNPGRRHPPGRSPAVLILFSDTGGGHRAAARALDEALRTVEPEIEIAWADPLIRQGSAIARRISSLYPTIIKRSPPTWGAIFHASNTAPSFAAIVAALRSQLVGVLQQQLRLADPDVVISVHPLLNHVTAAVLQRESRARGLMTVVTDLIDVHRGWLCRRADLIVVPTQQAYRAALRRRMLSERLRLFGLPVDLRFRPPMPGEPAVVRRRLGLDAQRSTVLVAGGGEGSGSLWDQVLALALEPHPWQVIAVCGRNDRLRDRLLGVQFQTPTLVLGFVQDMPELLRACDLVVGKAGPGAIAEALATGVPLVLTSYLPGQERSNVSYVVESGVGRYTPSPDRLLRAVDELLAGSDSGYPAMAARALELAHPGAALHIASACLALAAGYRATSHASR